LATKYFFIYITYYKFIYKEKRLGNITVHNILYNVTNYIDECYSLNFQ